MRFPKKGIPKYWRVIVGYRKKSVFYWTAAVTGENDLQIIDRSVLIYLFILQKKKLHLI